MRTWSAVFGVAALLVCACDASQTPGWQTPPDGATSPPQGSPTPTPTGAIFYEDFEADDGGFIVIGDNPSWEWGTPTNGPQAAYSGVNVWATNLNDDHNQEDSCLVTPMIDLPANPQLDIALRFQMASDTDTNFDLWYIRVADGQNVFDIDSGSGGDADTYEQKQYSLLSYAGTLVRIRFCLTTDADGFESPGLYIDDVAVLDL